MEISDYQKASGHLKLSKIRTPRASWTYESAASSHFSSTGRDSEGVPGKNHLRQLQHQHHHTHGVQAAQLKIVSKLFI